MPPLFTDKLCRGGLQQHLVGRHRHCTDWQGNVWHWCCSCGDSVALGSAVGQCGALGQRNGALDCLLMQSSALKGDECLRERGCGWLDVWLPQGTIGYGENDQPPSLITWFHSPTCQHPALRGALGSGELCGDSPLTLCSARVHGMALACMNEDGEFFFPSSPTGSLL